MQITKEQEERLRIANLVLWLQMCVFAADATDDIKWFNKQKTKSAMNTLVNIILKEYTPMLKTFWNVPDQLDMIRVTKDMQQIADLITDLNYLQMEDVIELITNYKKENHGKYL